MFSRLSQTSCWCELRNEPLVEMMNSWRKVREMDKLNTMKSEHNPETQNAQIDHGNAPGMDQIKGIRRMYDPVRRSSTAQHQTRHSGERTEAGLNARAAETEAAISQAS
jgi:hypothetical protein